MQKRPSVLQAGKYIAGLGAAAYQAVTQSGSTSYSRPILANTGMPKTVYKRPFTTARFRVKRKTKGYQSGRAVNKKLSELKCLDYTGTTSYFRSGTVGANQFNYLNYTIVGTEIYNRIGRKIYMKSVHIQGTIQPNATSLEGSGRILLIYDSAPNGAAPVIANVLFDQAPAGAASTIFSGVNLAYRQRFTILRDHKLILPSQTNTAGVETNLAYPQTNYAAMNINWFVKLKGLETVYSTSTGAIADCQSGALFLVCLTDLVDDKWQLTFNTRLRFYD